MTHAIFSYLYLVTDPYPAFNGRPSDGYPVDVTLPDAVPQRRVLVLVRIAVAIPALLVSAALTGGGGSFAFSRRPNGSRSAGGNVTGMAALAAVLGWFACIVQGKMPRGLRDTGAYGLGYRAQALAYVLLVTERYPNSDPHALLAGAEPPPLHPVRLEGDALDLRHVPASRSSSGSRVLIPHLVWLGLWGVLAWLALILQWFATLLTGRPVTAFHRFLSAYVRYAFHIYAFGSLAANPFPGFTGRAGVYPLDLVLPGPGRQNRWKTLFRGILVIPAFIVTVGLWGVVIIAAFLTWFTALFTARAPEGLRNVTAWALRYSGQTNAYLYLLTDVYPHSSPLEGAELRRRCSPPGPRGRANRVSRTGSTEADEHS